jgi:sialate O-acetylesterase
MKKFILAATAFLLYTTASANVRVAGIFSDSMVLQRGARIPVWGWAGKNEKIIVRFNKQVKTATAGNDGRWRVNLDPEKEGGPFQLSVNGNNTVVLNNVLVGDVWICSGQSNMEWTVSNSNNSVEEIAAANFPMIRHIKINTVIGEKPWDDIGRNSGWKTAVPANTGNFTAVGYFFARELYQQLHVPIGLINTTWGGTDVETWTSHEAFAANPEFADMIAKVPTLNLDSLAAIHEKAVMASMMKLQGGLPDKNAVALWKENNFNDSKWPHMQVPGLWEQQSLPGFDGVVWFRKLIDIPAASAGKPADISLGVIDDNDETYINGVKIGSTKAYNVNRVYHIPAGVLKAGKNILAIRVEDTGGGGGLYGTPSDLQLTMNDTKQPLSGEWMFQVESVQKSNSVGPNSYPSLLYNSMVNPLIPFAIKGAIWYQGENNAGRAYQYRTAFPLMITDWRKRWAQGDFPFYFVQLASFNSGNGNSEKGSTWAELREAQTLTLSLPNTGMAVTTDIGDAGNIHPKNKQDVGKRLAAVALHNAYGKNNVFSGPIYRSLTTEGNKAILSFSNTGSGLYVKDASLKGFEVAGADRKFYPATAMIEGDRVVVTAANVAVPVAVRYAWADDAGNANLYNREGFPAVSFRTDQWKGITEAAKYRNGQ